MSEASAEKLAEAFDDLGFELEAGKVTDRLAGMCMLHRLDEDKLSCEYLAFLSRKKLPITRSPDLDILDDFDKDLAKHLQVASEQKQAVLSVAGGKFADEGPKVEAMDDYDEDDADGAAMSFYGTPVRKPKRPRTSPQESPLSKKRPGVPAAAAAMTSPSSGGGGGSDDQQVLPFSPTSFRHTPRITGKYSARTNAGKVMIRFGEEFPGGATSSAFWTNESKPLQVQIKTLSKTHPKDYRFMFERLRDKAGYLDESICRLGDYLMSRHRLEAQDFSVAMQAQTLDCVGRVCCDSEGRLNAKSIVLQGSQDVCRGRALPIDTSQVAQYSLFPGQIVGVKATNPTGSKLVASEIFYDAAPAASADKSGAAASLDKMGGEPLQVVVVSGPYTTTDNLNYDPLADFLKYVAKHKPHLVIMCGPFVDAKHPKIDGAGGGGDLEVTFEGVFAGVMKSVAEAVQDLEGVQVLVVPSGARDVHHKFIYPTPAFEAAKTTDKIRMMTDPCVVDVEGITFGITSTDVLFHLGKEEISFPPRSGDRLRRLASHLLQQQSFYPLYPPNEEMNVDLEQLENIGQMPPEQPDVLVLPSDLLHFFKDINGCLAVNPQRLSRGESGGVFARIKVNPPTAATASKATASASFPARIAAEIVRI